MLTTLSIPVFWGIIAVVFVIVEISTYTLYGISIAIAAVIVSGYTFFLGMTDVDLVQGGIFVVVSTILSYFLPRWFSRGTQQKITIWLDDSVGKVFPLERVGSDWKVKIYGVDYLVDTSSIDSAFEVGMRVRLDAVHSGLLVVSRVR